jgi:hypothetical protein
MTDRRSDDQLDDRLRSAARSLASEPLPDGVLDSELAGASASGLRWVPSVAVLGLGVVAAALTVSSLRLGQAGQSTPSPVYSSEASPSVASQATPGPTIWPEYYLYAEEYGISIEETLRRMQIMEELDVEPLFIAVGDRWAGGWTEHEPELRYVVRLTGDGAEEFEAMTADWPLPVVFITGADHSESEILAAMERIQARIYEEFPTTGFWPDSHTGEIVLYGPDEPSAEFLAELEALGGVPVRYEYTPGEMLLEGSPAP